MVQFSAVISFSILLQGRYNAISLVICVLGLNFCGTLSGDKAWEHVVATFIISECFVDF